MTIVRPVILTNGHKRSDMRLQVPATQRSSTPSGTAWSFVSDAKLVTPGATWTLSAHKPASTLLDLANHAYVIYCLEGSDQLLAVAQEDWAALAAGGSSICPIAWVDSHHDLTLRLLTVPLPFIWVMTTPSATAYLYNQDGTSTGWSLSTVATAGFGAVRAVGTDVWALHGTAVSRLHSDGSSAGADITGLSGPQDMLVVGSTVWIAEESANQVSRWNFDGTSAGASLTQATLGQPQQLLFVGAEVWVIGIADGSPTQPINRFSTAGAFIGAVDPASGSNYARLVLGVVGSEVWAAQRGETFGSFDPIFWGPGALWRMHLDGTSAGSRIDADAIMDPTGIVALGGNGWVVDEFGKISGVIQGSALIYHADGTPDTASPIVDPNLLRSPFQAEVFGSRVWITAFTAGIAMYNADGTLYRRANPIYLPVNHDAIPDIRDMTAVLMPPLPPPPTITTTTPSGGTSGGVTTLGLVGTAGATLTATTDVAIDTSGFFLVILDETDVIVGRASGGTIATADVWQPLGAAAVSHTYQAALEGFSGFVARTNTVTVAWGPNAALLTATVSTDVGPTSWFILIVEDGGTILASAGSGTTCAFTVPQASVTGHTFAAYLSTDDVTISGDAVASGALSSVPGSWSGSSCTTDLELVCITAFTAALV